MFSIPFLPNSAKRTAKVQLYSLNNNILELLFTTFHLKYKNNNQTYIIFHSDSKVLNLRRSVLILKQ